MSFCCDLHLWPHSEYLKGEKNYFNAKVSCSFFMTGECVKNFFTHMFETTMTINEVLTNYNRKNHSHAYEERDREGRELSSSFKGCWCLISV